MREARSLIWTALVRLFRSRASLVAEILVLRHQINIQRRHLPKRQTFRIMDRLIFAGLYRLAPNVLNALAILKPETVLKWHRAGSAELFIAASRHRMVPHAATRNNLMQASPPKILYQDRSGEPGQHDREGPSRWHGCVKKTDRKPSANPAEDGAPNSKKGLKWHFVS
jgi:hypothetical protein